MIVLDVETTGLDPEKNSLVSIAALDFDDSEERFYQECRIWEEAEIDPKALLINGLTDIELVDIEKKTESDIVKNFLYWIKDKRDITIAGQNPSFDVNFIKAAAERAGEVSTLPFRTIDIHSLAWAHMKSRGEEPPIENNKSSLGSDRIMKYVGLPPEPKPHVGINSVLWEYEAIFRLINGVPKLEEFKEFPVPFREV